MNSTILPVETLVVAALLFVVVGTLLFLYLRRYRQRSAKSSYGWETSYEGIRYQEQALAIHNAHETLEKVPLSPSGSYSTTLQTTSPPEITPAMPFEAASPAKLPEMVHAALVRVPEMAHAASVQVPEMAHAGVNTPPLDELTRPVPVASIANTATAYLDYVSGGEHLTQQFSISAGELARFGRSGRFCEYVLDDVRVSRLHASILYTDGDFYLEDEGSSGGTYINRQRLKVADKHLLYYGDLINFNEITYRFRVIN